MQGGVSLIGGLTGYMLVRMTEYGILSGERGIIDHLVTTNYNVPLDMVL